jgi:nucleoside-diphosphate-sugar epimerase
MQILLIKKCLIFILMVTKILLTGSNGFLGSFIFKEFSDHSIKGLSRNSSDYNIDLAKNAPLFNESFDLIIHCAGIAHFIPINDQESRNFFDVNVVGTSNLLIGLSNNPLPKHFVFISSVSVYGLNEGITINEDFPLLAKDPYGISKIEAEAIVKKWCDENNVICTILRLPLIVGTNPPGNLGAMIKAIRNGYYFNISEGSARKSMVLATDIGKFIRQAASIGGIYNLTDGFHPSFYELSHFIAMQNNKKFVLRMPMLVARILALIGDKVGQKFPINSHKLSKIISSLTFDDTKARNTLGWNPSPVLKGFKIND